MSSAKISQSYSKLPQVTRSGSSTPTTARSEKRVSNDLSSLQHRLKNMEHIFEVEKTVSEEFSKKQTKEENKTLKMNSSGIKRACDECGIEDYIAEEKSLEPTYYCKNCAWVIAYQSKRENYITNLIRTRSSTLS